MRATRAAGSAVERDVGELVDWEARSAVDDALLWEAGSKLNQHSRSIADMHSEGENGN
jgi:hypothetical protein